MPWYCLSNDAQTGAAVPRLTLGEVATEKKAWTNGAGASRVGSPNCNHWGEMRKMRWTHLLLLIVCGAAPLVLVAQSESKPAADLIITNAKVWTEDKSTPTAEAVAVLGERIVAVGSSSEIDAWRGPKTQVVEAGGKLLLPGFNDSHVHFVDGGAQLDAVQLTDATSAEEFARRIGERAKITPKGEWILGGDWDETKWNPPELPTKELIDRVAPDTPVFVSRYDGHMGVANSLALELAGITAKTPDVPGGVIVRDAQGNPTGALKDAAQAYIEKAIPPMSHAQRLRAARRATLHAAAVGVTSVQNMSAAYADIGVYAELLESGELKTRIYAAPLITHAVDDQSKLGIRRAFGGPWLRIGAVKAFADGSLGSRTAYFFQPYDDQPNNRGLLAGDMHPLSLMRDRMMRADAAGLQICTHAIGDEAISIILDLYSEIENAHGEADRRLRIEHAQHMAAKDFDRFAQLHVIASMQPYHAIDDGRWAEARIGHDRASRTYAFRTFLNHGVRLAFGTDWDVAPLNPLLGIYAAVTRATLDGKHRNGWFPEQKLTVGEAVEAYTTGSAYAEFQEKEKGSIAPGKLGDMVLLSDDIFSIAPEKIRDVKVLKTFVGGKLVWDASHPAGGEPSNR
jgi:predicted amidohydrolase YtcJ